MLTPLPKGTFHTMATRWAKIISLPGENVIEIWPPLDAPDIRIRQLLADSALQKELFPTQIPYLVEINAKELDVFTFSDFEKQIGTALHQTNTEPFNLESWLMQNTKPLALFLVGFDTFLQKKDFAVLNHLSVLSRKYPQLTILLFTSLPMTLTAIYQDMKLHNLLGNIFYQTVYNFEDSLHFIQHMEEQWNMTVSDTINNELAKHLQGHLFLLKAGVRLLRDNPAITVKDILSAPAIQRRSLAIFHGLSDADKKTVLTFLDGNSADVSEYLQKTRILNPDGTVGFPYWHETKQLLSESFDKKQKHFSYALDFQLTSVEREVFDIFMENALVVTREKIAKTLWRNEWMERYSDWAIDQMIHRIREKLEKSAAPYEIVTKKGEGFYLKNK